MLTQQQQQINAPPRFRIWTPGDCDEHAGSQSGISPRMTLREFFERWFRPIVLVGDKNASESTITLYRDALAWWERLAGDPPLEIIDEYVIANFKARLRTATYQRTPGGTEYPLRSSTQHKIMRQIRAILHRLGPTTDPKRPGKAVLPESPYLAVPPAEACRPKPCFTIERARAMYAAASEMRWGRARSGVRIPDVACSLVWRAILSLWYFTGWRSGTSIGIGWDHVFRRGSEAWFSVPAELVPKTHKADEKFIHRDLLRDLERVRTASGLLIPWPYSYSHLVDQHEMLQAIAGIPEAEQLSPQAWRRTHGTEMAKVGADAAIKAAQHALDHGDESTTRESYVSLEPQFIKRLPRLTDEEHADDDDRQLKLF